MELHCPACESRNIEILEEYDDGEYVDLLIRCAVCNKQFECKASHDDYISTSVGAE